MRNSVWMWMVTGLLVVIGTPAVWADSPVGRWWTAERASHIEIATQPDGTLTGTVVWLKNRRDDGTPFRDDDNPDPALRGRPVLGIELLQNLKPGRRAGVWDGGTIYDPNNGKTYRAILRQDEADTLRVRGFIGVALLGRTTIWTRVTDADTE